MADPDKTVFLSYRRDVSWATAHLVRNDLAEHGFDVFLDVRGLDSGEFERVILREIERRTHFLVVLEPRSLDRVAEEGDWLHREIAHALAHERNVVPLLANGARMSRARDLPADIARLPAFNAVSVPQDYFAEAMQKLRERFLRGLNQGTPSGEPTPSPSRPRRPDLARPTLSQRRSIDTPLLVTLVWTKVDGAQGYEVEQSATADYPIGGPTTRVMGRTHHDVLQSEFGRARFFRVRAWVMQGPGRFVTRGPWSNIVEVP